MSDFERVDLSPDVTLYLGDCLEVMPTLAAGSVDAVITDPPFNSGREEIANDCLSEDDWADFCDRFSLLVNAKNILIEVGKNDIFMRRYMDLRHRYRWLIVLNYTNSMRQGAVGYSNTGIILWYGEGICHRRFMDRIDAPLENTIGVFSHPSPKTTAHYKRLVDMFSAIGDLILDPFAGSGTTGVAAIRAGRRVILIEQDPGYFEIAVRRCERELAQPRLFTVDAPTPKPEQGAMEL